MQTEFLKRLAQLEEEHELLLRQPNEKAAQSNGIFTGIKSRTHCSAYPFVLAV